MLPGVRVRSRIELPTAARTANAEEGQGLEIVNTIIRLAHDLKMRVVAEGIETREQLAELQRLGGRVRAGVPVAKPMPANEASAYIEQVVSASPGQISWNN